VTVSFSRRTVLRSVVEVYYHKSLQYSFHSPLLCLQGTSSSWRTDCYSVGQELSFLYKTVSFITVCTKSLLWILCSARSIQSMASHPVSLRSMSTSSHLRTDFRSGLFHSSVYRQKFCIHFLLLPCVLYVTHTLP